MLGELPKLFGKAFVIGYLLPSVLIGAAIYFVICDIDPQANPLAFLKTKDVLDATFALVLIWLGAVFLMALNVPIIRFLEGYGSYNPFRLADNMVAEAYVRLATEAQSLRERRRAARAAGQPASRPDAAKYAAALDRLAMEYPDDERWVLPTKFGNTIRAFEVYPRVIYGLESVHAWSRLSALIPGEYKASIEEAKAKMDFWVNLWIAALGMAIFHIGYMLFEHDASRVPHIASAVAAALAFSWFARKAAAGWGSLVKSSFDLFRADLCLKLGFEMPRSRELELEMWQRYSQVMTHRSTWAADRLVKFKPLEGQRK